MYKEGSVEVEYNACNVGAMRVSVSLCNVSMYAYMRMSSRVEGEAKGQHKLRPETHISAPSQT